MAWNTASCSQPLRVSLPWPGAPHRGSTLPTHRAFSVLSQAQSRQGAGTLVLTPGGLSPKPLGTGVTPVEAEQAGDAVSAQTYRWDRDPCLFAPVTLARASLVVSPTEGKGEGTDEVKGIPRQRLPQGELAEGFGGQQRMLDLQGTLSRPLLAGAHRWPLGQRRLLCILARGRLRVCVGGAPGILGRWPRK